MGTKKESETREDRSLWVENTQSGSKGKHKEQFGGHAAIWWEMMLD